MMEKQHLNFAAQEHLPKALREPAPRRADPEHLVPEGNRAERRAAARAARRARKKGGNIHPNEEH